MSSDEYLKHIPFLINECDFLSTIWYEASGNAAKLGHKVFYDWHFFPVLITNYRDCAATKTVLYGLHPCLFLDRLSCMTNGDDAIPSIVEVSSTVVDLLCAVHCDATAILKGKDIGPSHFYLYYLTHPNNVIYNIFESLKLNIPQIRKSIIQSLNIEHWMQIDWYYTQLHDTCKMVNEKTGLACKPNQEKIQYIEHLFPLELPPDSEVESIECHSNHKYVIKTKTYINQEMYFEKFKDKIKDLIVEYRDEAFRVILPNHKGVGYFRYDENTKYLYLNIVMTEF